MVLGCIIYCMQGVCRIGESLSNKELEALRSIRNSIIHGGVAPSVRGLMKVLGYRSPRSAALIIDKLIKKKFLKREPNGKLQIIKDFEDNSIHGQTIDVPLVGTVACGIPILAEENIEAAIPVSVNLAKSPYKYFLLRAAGDSMNERNINNSDLVLVRQQITANTGDNVVALIDGEATIKELQISGETIILKPKSTNKEHQPIILDRDFRIQGVVVTTITNL